MSREAYVAEILDEFGRSVGLSGLALDRSSRASLVIGETPVTFAYAIEPVETLWLHLDLGALPPDEPAALDCLLELGFLTWASGRMTIGVDDDGNRAVGHTPIPVVNLELATLRGQLEQVLVSAAAIRDRLARRAFDLDRTAA